VYLNTAAIGPKEVYVVTEVTALSTGTDSGITWEDRRMYPAHQLIEVRGLLERRRVDKSRRRNTLLRERAESILLSLTSPPTLRPKTIF